MQSKSEQLPLRVTPAEKAAVVELARLRLEETGDGSIAGWFRAVLRREARERGIKIGVAEEAPAPAPAVPPKRRKR